MLTQSDLQKIQELLASMEKRQDAKFVSKDDLAAMEKRLSEKIVKDVSDMIQSAVIKILNEHEARLDRLEKTIGGFPPITS